MPLNKLTPAEVRRAGWDALREKLGPANALKFILDYDRGPDNSTGLRKKIFMGETVKNIFFVFPRCIGIAALLQQSTIVNHQFYPVKFSLSETA